MWSESSEESAEREDDVDSSRRTGNLVLDFRCSVWFLVAIRSSSPELLCCVWFLVAIRSSSSELLCSVWFVAALRFSSSELLSESKKMIVYINKSILKGFLLQVVFYSQTKYFCGKIQKLVCSITCGRAEHLVRSNYFQGLYSQFSVTSWEKVFYFCC